MSINSSNPQLGSFMTLSTKRDALWNVVEPGDPYDIRKSMIAKVPGDKKNFMGDYLSIVCLFQAAQIERLCEFLDDFKLKYREIERRQLDRHSYEIQIKELNHKLAEQSSFREENQKLRDFIKNINSNRQEQDESIRGKFQKLLIQFKNTEDQNARLRQEIRNLNSQISTFDAKYQAFRKSKQTQIQEIYSRFNQQTTISSQFEINTLRSQYESEIQRISLENQRLKQGQDQNLRQLAAWQQKYRALQQQIFINQPQQDTNKNQRSIAEYQNRFKIFGQEIDKLNLMVRDINSKFQSSQQKNRDYEMKLQAANREFSLLQNKSNSIIQQNQILLRKNQDLQNQNRRLQQSGTYSQENESKLRFANEEIIRLNNQVRVETENSNRLKAQLSRLQYEGSKVSILESQLYESKQIATQNNSLRMQMAEKQNQIAFLKQQIERLNEEIFKNKRPETNYQPLLGENQRLQRVIQQLETRNRMMVQEFESRYNQKVTEYENRIELINKTKGSEFESRASLLQGQVQRLGELINKRNEEIENLQRQNRQIKSNISQSEFQMNRKIQNYQSVIQGLKRQNDEMIKKIRELETFQRKSTEYQNKNIIISQEVDRLNYQLKNKDMDIENLKIKLRDQEIAIIQRYQMDTSRKMGSYEVNLNNLARENQQLKRKYVQMENKTALLSQQIQRLSTKLRQIQTLNTRYEQDMQQLQKVIRDTQVNLKNTYETQIAQKQTAYQMTIRSLQGQTDQEIRGKLLQLQNSNKRISDYERALDQVSKQLQRLGSALRQKNEENLQFDNKNKSLQRQLQDLGRKYLELQNMVRSKYQVEASTRITNLQQNISVFTRQNQQLKRYIQDCQNRFKDQNSAIQQLNNNLRNIVQQNEGLKRQIQETQFSYRNKLDVEVTSQYRAYEKTIKDLKKDLENFVRQNNQLKNFVQRQESQITALKQEDQRLRSQLHGRLEESYYKISQTDSIVGQLKNQNENLKRARDEIERNFRQYEAEASQKTALLAQQHERILNHLQNKTQELGKSQQQVRQVTNKLQLLQRSMNQSQSSVQQFQMQVNTRISQYQQNITILTQQNAELQNKLKIINQLNYKIAEYENKIVIINQQLERVNQNLRKQVQKSTQLQNSLRNAVAQNNQLTKNITDLKNSISEKYEVQATRTIRTLQQNIQLFKNQNEQLKGVITRYEQELNNRGLEIQRLTTNSNNLTEQNKQLKNQIRETQVMITQRYQTQVSSRYTAYEKDVANYQRQIDDLMKKLIEYAQRVVPQYENQAVTLRQQIQRLNARFNQDNSQLANSLNLLSQENEGLKKQIAQLQVYIQKEQTETKQKSSSYEQNLVLLQRENEDLKRYIQQFGGQYEGLGKSHQNLQRQIQQYHTRVESETKKGELLQKEVTNLGRENNELKKKLVQMQQQLQRVIGKLNELSQQNERVRRQARENQMELSQRLQMETVQQVNMHRQQLSQMDTNLKASQRQIEILQKRLTDFGQDANKKITSYDEELRKLANQIQKRNITIQDYDTKIRSILNQNEQLKKHFRETEVNFNRTFQTQIKNRTINYEQTIETITKNAQNRQKEILQNSNKRIMELENKAVLLAQQLQRLNQILKAKHQETQIMHQQIQRLTNTLRLQIEQNKHLENQHHNLRSHTQSQFMQLQSSYELILKDNENYKKNLHDYQNSIKKLYAEFERLQKIINDYKTERQSLFQKNFGLSNEIQRLNAEIKRLQVEVEEVRLRLSDEAALQKRINEHMALMVVLFAEIESLRKRVKDKQKEMQDVRRSSLAPFKLESRQLGEKN